MGEVLGDLGRIFDAAMIVKVRTALRTLRDVDIEYPLEATGQSSGAPAPRDGARQREPLQR